MEFNISKILTEKGPLKLGALAQVLGEPDRKKVRRALQMLRTRYFDRSGVYCRAQLWLVDPDVVSDQINPARFEKRGEFSSHQQWVNKAASWIGGCGYFCFDATGRRCRNGGDMRTATFPVGFYELVGKPDPVLRIQSETAVGARGDVVVGKLVSFDGNQATVKLL